MHQVVERCVLHQLRLGPEVMREGEGNMCNFRNHSSGQLGHGWLKDEGELQKAPAIRKLDTIHQNSIRKRKLHLINGLSSLLLGPFLATSVRSQRKEIANQWTQLLPYTLWWSHSSSFRALPPSCDPLTLPNWVVQSVLCVLQLVGC